MHTEEELIIIDRFSIPKIESIDSNDLALITNSDKIPGTDVSNFHCKNGLFKFCLVIEKDEMNEPIFIMEFFKSSKIMQELLNEGPTIKLELIWVNANHRNKHIATYYMKKLVQFAKDEGFIQIRITPSPDAKIFKKDKKDNRLNKDQLTKFYKKFEDDVLKITFI